MTFNEYVNQTNPKRQHNVEVKENDCYQTFNDYNGKVVILLINNEFYHYLLPKNRPSYSNLLYTMDSHGNKKSLSCFKFIES